MKLLALLMPLLLAGCMISPPISTKPNELDAAGKAAFIAAINAKRGDATTITCVGGASLGYKNPQSYLAASAPVIWNDKLAAAALNNASFLATRQVDISSGDPHNDAGNGTVFVRVSSTKYPFAQAGETVASGTGAFFITAAEVAQGWQDSTNAHCNLMLDPAMKDVGGALVTSANGTRYWVMVIGKPQ